MFKTGRAEIQPRLVKDASRLQNALQTLNRTLTLRERDRACCFGLSVSQSNALQALTRHGPLTISQLGDQLLLEKSTASRLALGLIRKGLARKRAVQTDGRSVILQLTEAGHRMARRILKDLMAEHLELALRINLDVLQEMPTLLTGLSRAIGDTGAGQGESAHRGKSS